jgi:hypothetical protein
VFITPRLRCYVCAAEMRRNIHNYLSARTCDLYPDKREAFDDLLSTVAESIVGQGTGGKLKFFFVECLLDLIEGLQFVNGKDEIVLAKQIVVRDWDVDSIWDDSIRVVLTKGDTNFYFQASILEDLYNELRDKFPGDPSGIDMLWEVTRG